MPCNKDFENKSSLQQHFRMQHKGVHETDLKCKECGMVLATKEKHKSHRKQEHELKYCLKCGKGGFISVRKLRSHRSSCLRTRRKLESNKMDIGNISREVQREREIQRIWS